MKLKSLIIVLLCCQQFISYAQGYHRDSNQQGMYTRHKKKQKEYKKDVVKLNLTGLFIKSMGVQYEYKIARKSTLAFGLIYRPKSSWLVSKLYDTTNANSGSTSISLESRYMFHSSKFRSFMITPEYRYYLGRQAPNGLYAAPFIRMRANRIDFNFHYYDDNTMTPQLGLATINETLLGAGVMLGYQIITRKRLTVDFWFVGPWCGYYFMHLKSKVNAANISELQKIFISQDMKPVINDITTVKWDDKGVNTKFSQLDWGLRMMGVNIGWSF